MAAAVFLHNAIFTADPPPLPSASLAHRAPNRGGPHNRQLSSVSSVTLQTSTSEHSHPTEPLIHPGDSESSVYLDLLARQPTHPSRTSQPPIGQGLSLQGDPVTPRERRSVWERSVRKRLKRLRWAGRVLLTVICGWAIYNTARYYIGVTLHQYRDRQIIGLVLGSCTALCIACLLVTIIIATSGPHFGWYYRPRSTHVLLQDFLTYTSSLCVLAPAVVNLVLVFLWRGPSDTLNSLRGRCHWDIDVVWSGLGGQCDHSPAWGTWLAGAVVRLLLTAAIIIAYHAVSYKYLVTRQPSRRRHTSMFRNSTASFPSASSQSFRAMTTASSTTAPVSVESSLNNHHPQQQQPSPIVRERAASVNNSEPRALRSARSLRIMANDISPAGSRVIRRAVSATSLKPAARSPESQSERLSSSSSSDDDLAEDGSDGRYGRPLRPYSAAYTSIPGASPSRGEASGGHAGGAWEPVPDADLNSFADQFRALVEQVSRETDEAVAYAQSDRHFPSLEPNGNDAARVVVGRTIHRMPTIESLGSHEVVSLASYQGGGMGSRPSTRSNTLSGVDGPPSRSGSRANSLATSLDAAVSLSLSSDAPPSGGIVGGIERAVSELGEMTPSPTASVSGGALFSSRSTGSYYTAGSSRIDGGTEER
ncbi:hypothetical protein BC628DRAFT_1313857 [Trametes gibbosa]|nr:hypothetical protein BC628DRAFT_1313857 [Trametes gibbosa]